jgi:hypothetical protein
MINRRNFRQYATILAFAVSAVLFLPEVAFSKGAVIGYVWGNDTPTPDQLDRLTHQMVFYLYMDA